VGQQNQRQPLDRPSQACQRPLNTTFVYGETRAIYNAGSQYSGSPYHAPSYNTPTGNKCDYVVVFPSDDAFLGETELNLLQPGNGGEDVIGPAEQHSYWIAGELGLPSCHRRPILVWSNGVKRGVVYEDAQQPNGDFVKDDSYSYGGGQNMYAYKPERGPWQLLIWDIDFAFLSALPTSDMVGIGGVSVGPVNTHPRFTRKYYQAMIDAVQGPMDTNKFSAILDDRRAGAPWRRCCRPARHTGTHPLPSLPALALNELMPVNTATLRDNLGRYRPWLELHNDAANDQPLSDCFLSPTPTNLTAWRFPAGASVPAHGFLIVWLDGDIAASTDAGPHAGFSADTSGTVTLSQLLEGRAVGDLPDGDLLRRHILATPTPNRPNTAAAPSIRVFINEWLADNTSVLTDPADGDAEDWFELYNAGASSVSLTGYHLSNSRENPTRFRIPKGYRLPPGGHLGMTIDLSEAEWGSLGTLRSDDLGRGAFRVPRLPGDGARFFRIRGSPGDF